MIRRRSHVVVVGLALCAALATEAAAHSSAARAERERRRCERALEREGSRYGELYGAQVGYCVRLLAECETAGSNPASNQCAVVRKMCAATAASNIEELRLRQRLIEACEDVPMDVLMGDLAFGDQMADCAPTTLAAFVDCFREHVAGTQGTLVGQLRPTACKLLEQNGLADKFPAVKCVPSGGTCEPTEPCEPSGPTGPLACGGTENVACGSGFACDRHDALCTNPQVSGACVAVPETCADDGQPVCGCDGQTYASDCARLQAGVVLARAGACDPPPSSCSSSAQCPAGFFCEYVFGDCGEGQPGTCRPMRAEPCDLCSAWVDGPVCGCDGQTYASECERRAAGASKFWFGSCF